MKGLHMLAYTLLWVGGFSWGLVGLFNYNLIAILGPSLERLVYILVGIATVYVALTHKSDCKVCG